MDLLAKGGKSAIRCQVLAHNDDFGKPGRNRGAMLSRRLDVTTGIGYHTERPPLENMSCFLLIRGLSFLLLLVACLLRISLRIPWEDRLFVLTTKHL
jgi:hypothetical protein